MGAIRNSMKRLARRRSELMVEVSELSGGYAPLVPFELVPSPALQRGKLIS